LASVFKRDDVKGYYELIQVIAVVDAENVEDRMGEVPEIYRQLVAADLILVNKCDLVQASYLFRLHELIRRVNPFAEVRDVIQGRMPFGLRRERSNLDRLEKPSDPGKETEPGHRMKSISVEVPELIDRGKLYTALSMTLLLHYHQVYRIKGFVKVKGEQHPILVQSTGNKLSMERVESEGKAPKLVLVFIGRGIERKGIERILDRVKVVEGVG
jgi:G3E family GTPase